MEKIFNVAGTCFPDIHYMVDLRPRIAEIRKMIERGDYFAINRGRQYGKTTTLYAMESDLQEDFVVVSLDFQEMSYSCFSEEDVFCKSFCEIFLSTIEITGEERIDKETLNVMEDFVRSEEQQSLKSLSILFRDLCKNTSTPIVLLIDEVDSASNNQVFLDFLATLRFAYLNRRRIPTFQSVILAGVHDIRHLKSKIRPEDQHKINSPWNIAANFDVKMQFDAEEIAGMLEQYEADHHTGMDIAALSKKLYEYTSGYPVMVSWLCKNMAEKQKDGFNLKGLEEAVKTMIESTNVPVFDSMIHQITDYPELKNMLRELVFSGVKIQYNPDNYAINLGLMFCYLKRDKNYCVVANWIFEQRLLGLFVSEGSMGNEFFRAGQIVKSQFVRDDGKLDMDVVMRKFVEYFHDIYSEKIEKFAESDGRRLFMLYVRPIINGSGNYYIEAETRDATRSDLVIDYANEQYVVEMKIWHGDEYDTRGKEQLRGYMDRFHLDKGYLLSFSFNKNKKVGMNTIMIDGKTIVEAVV